jgi:hypothetical protein
MAVSKSHTNVTEIKVFNEKFQWQYKAEKGNKLLNNETPCKKYLKGLNTECSNVH